MYLLEDTEVARSMRENVVRLLESKDKNSIILALQLIEAGGFHECFMKQEKDYVVNIVNVLAKGFLTPSQKRDDKFTVKTYFFENAIKNLPHNIFRFIFGKVVVNCYVDNPCSFKYYGYFFIACENVKHMEILTTSKRHKSMLSIIKFVLQESSVTIKDDWLFEKITIIRE